MVLPMSGPARVIVKYLIAVWLAACSVAFSVVSAQPLALAQLPESASVQSLWLVSEQGSATTIDQILQLESGAVLPAIRWQAQSDAPVGLSASSTLWIKLELAPFGDTVKPRILQFPVPGLDRIESFRVEKSATTLNEIAGDSISASVWPISARHPSFEIVADRWEPVTYYFAVRHSGPFSLAGQLQSPYQNMQSSMADYLGTGVLLGAMMLMACLGMAGCFWYRNWAFAAFSVYAVTTAALFFSINGMLGQFWLGTDAQLIDSAPRMLAALTAATGLFHYFGAVAMQQLSRWRFWVGVLICLASLGVMALQSESGGLARQALLSYVCLGFAATLVGLSFAFFKDEPWTSMHLVSVLPYALALTFPLLEMLGIASMTPRLFDVLALAAVASLGLTFFALNSKTRELNESNLRLEASAMADPLTGVANYRRLVVRASGLFSRAKYYKHHGALLLIEVANMADIQRKSGQRGMESALLQTAVIVRNSIKNIDLVSRVSDELFAVALEGPMTSQDASSVAAKIIAGALRVKESVDIPVPLMLRICIDLVPRETENVDRLISNARQRLRRVHANDPKCIFVIGEASFMAKA